MAKASPPQPWGRCTAVPQGAVPRSLLSSGNRIAVLPQCPLKRDAFDRFRKALIACQRNTPFAHAEQQDGFDKYLPVSRTGNCRKIRLSHLPSANAPDNESIQFADIL